MENNKYLVPGILSINELEEKLRIELEERNLTYVKGEHNTAKIFIKESDEK